MGAFAPRRGRTRRLTPQVRAFGAILFGLAFLVPVEGQAHRGLQQTQQTEVRKDCTVERVPGRTWIRGVGTCGNQIAAQVQPQRMMISGKLGKALAAVLYCRLASVVTEFTLKAPASLPVPSSPQRLITAPSNIAGDPANCLAPAPNLGSVKAPAVERLADG